MFELLSAPTVFRRHSFLFVTLVGPYVYVRARPVLTGCALQYLVATSRRIGMWLGVAAGLPRNWYGVNGLLKLLAHVYGVRSFEVSRNDSYTNVLFVVHRSHPDGHARCMFRSCMLVSHVTDRLTQGLVTIHSRTMCSTFHIFQRSSCGFRFINAG